MRHTKLLAILVLATVALVLGSGSCLANPRTPRKYLIPDGYVGWVRIDYEVKETPEIQIVDKFYVFRIPKTGVLQTSSKLEYGAALDEFYYYSGETLQRLPLTGRGGDGMVWAGFNGYRDEGTGKQIYEYFFVGTEEQLKAFRKPDSPGERPRVGDVRELATPKERSFN